MAKGGVKIVSINGALTVTFTAASGATPTVYSDEALTAAVSLPATVADGATSTFYFASPGSYTVSVKDPTGIQIAADLNTTKTVNVFAGDIAVLSYDCRRVARDASGDTGRRAAKTESDGTYVAFAETVNTVAASGAAVTLPDVTAATIHLVTLTANCTVTFPAAVTGKSFTVALKQDGTGSRTVTWPGTVLWGGGTAPTLTTTAAKTDVFSFVCADGTHWLGFTAGLNY